MAKCGITQYYPVKVVTVTDDGSYGPEHAIGITGTLGRAVKLAESQGFRVRDSSDGGQSRFFLDRDQGRHYFIVTVYPD